MSQILDPFQLNSIALFCKAAELGNFTSAAEAMGVTPAAVSRSIGRLEARLNVKLFARTTRHVKLTDDGRAYFEQCEQALAQLQEAERIVTGNQSSPSGRLRVSVPTTYGHHRILPILPKFMKKFPLINLDVSISNRNIDFVEEGFDVAVRMGALDDSRLIAHKLEDAALCVFASPAYLKRSTKLRSIADLSAHDCIQFIMPSSGRPIPWSFLENKGETDFVVQSRIQIQDDVLGGVTLAKAGGGVFQSYRFIVARELQSGELVEVLKANAGRSRPFNILYPQNRHLSTRVRVFVDFVREHFRGK
jgi:DNA-binding transcriptional LysR family regulator